MAFVVETGSGLTNANSYLSVADADTYHTDYGGSTTWSGASEADKQEALRMATQYLDVHYNGRWLGQRSNADQALAWPRMYIQNDDGYWLDFDNLPTALEQATAEMALRYVAGTDRDVLVPDISQPGNIKEYQVKAGDVMEKTVYLGGRSQTKSYPIIDGLLYQLIIPSYNIERA